jgi:hypothetical protein
MDMSYSQNDSDKLPDDNSFRDFYKSMRDHAKQVLTTIQVDEDTQRSIISSMKGIQRRSFLDKFNKLLKDWEYPTKTPESHWKR